MTKNPGAVSSPSRVAVVPCEGSDGLANSWGRMQEVLPGLLPASLPATVLIKPNLCDIVAWENGVTTDPAWLSVLARALRAIRPNVRICVVESDAIGAYKTYRSCDETFARLGYASAAQELDIELINLSKAVDLEVSLHGIPYPVRLPQLLLEEFFFISIANLKVHPYERMTGILKNSLGLLSDADISHFHPYLSVLISRLHSWCPPDLCIIDARIGLEGHGPIIGSPVKMGSIVFGNDAFATDLVACKLMGVSPNNVPHLRQLSSDLGRTFTDFSCAGDIHSRSFKFDEGRSHSSILIKFANRRLHRSSELFTNRWIDRLIRFIREIHRILRDDGVFVGVVPNYAGWSSIKFGPTWNWLQPHNHYSHFTPESIKQLMTLEGFEVEIRSEEGRYGDVLIRKDFGPQEIRNLFSQLKGSELVFAARKARPASA